MNIKNVIEVKVWWEVGHTDSRMWNELIQLRNVKRSRFQRWPHSNNLIKMFRLDCTRGSPLSQPSTFTGAFHFTQEISCYLVPPIFVNMLTNGDIKLKDFTSEKCPFSLNSCMRVCEPAWVHACMCVFIHPRTNTGVTFSIRLDNFCWIDCICVINWSLQSLFMLLESLWEEKNEPFW